MNRVFLALIPALSLSAFANENEKYDSSIFKNTNGDIFELNINTSFDGNVNFLVSKEKDKYYLIVNASKEKLHKERIELTEQQLQIINKNYKNALKYNAKDDVQGLDGAIWCFTVDNKSKSKEACFWSPEYKSEARGLGGITELGKSLWKFTDLDQKGFKLY